MHCAICSGSSSCFSCQIKELKSVVQSQAIELRYWKGESCKLLQCKKDYNTFFETSTQLLLPNYIGENTEYKFITITYDPRKFGQFNNKSDEQNYILKQLLRLIKANHIKSLAGCFEYQKNGTTHAHLIARVTCCNTDIENYLRPKFTDDPRNNKAVKCEDPRSFNNIENYLKKESTEYFRYDTAASIDLDYQSIEDLPKKEKPQQCHFQKSIQYMESEIKRYQETIKKYNNILYRTAQK
uniref:hypothetical protein n=1 Tax=Flavobacterium sp. TaxID=239 RepID=UPI0040478851